MSNTTRFGLIVIVLLAFGFGVFWWLRHPTTIVRAPITTASLYDKDVTLLTDLTIPADQQITLRNNITLTVNGNVTVHGSLSCDDGAINLVIKGNLEVDNLLQCFRTEGRKAGDIGNAIMIVVGGNVTFGKDALVASNGHVQIVRDASQLVTAAAGVDALYAAIADPAKDTSKFRIGPFLPNNGDPNLPVRKTSSLLPADLFVSKALAQATPATDLQGNAVANTVKLGGTWIVGNPTVRPPADLTIPRPPSDIAKIILNFNFGGDKVTLQNFELTGPDGREGKSGGGCKAQGTNGQDAMRLNVNADSIEINTITLNLGSGGNGGDATTDGDCDQATAKGGDGGEPGNFKMVADSDFSISGAFTINPGHGGNGGSATATGKDGTDGCNGTNGGSATATGGNGGDSKKSLSSSGVQGVDNVQIGDQAGGHAGDATATGGAGGSGTTSKCNGGDGGSATATGGKGGSASSSGRSMSLGGNGGNASATPGAGGKGGKGKITSPGGKGGKGGTATAKPGNGGSGSAPGTDGQTLAQTGGNGGDGADGCAAGKGGAGGGGSPAGQPGESPEGLIVSQPGHHEDGSGCDVVHCHKDPATEKGCGYGPQTKD